MLFTKFRIGVLAGSALGYVFGTKAGRERYEQIQQQWSKVRGSDAGQQLEHEVRTTASQASEALDKKLDDGVSRISDKVDQAKETASSGVSSLSDKAQESKDPASSGGVSSITGDVGKGKQPADQGEPGRGTSAPGTGTGSRGPGGGKKASSGMPDSVFEESSFKQDQDQDQ